MLLQGKSTFLEKKNCRFLDDFFFTLKTKKNNSMVWSPPLKTLNHRIFPNQKSDCSLRKCPFQGSCCRENRFFIQFFSIFWAFLPIFGHFLPFLLFLVHFHFALWGRCWPFSRYFQDWLGFSGGPPPIISPILVQFWPFLTIFGPFLDHFWTILGPNFIFLAFLTENPENPQKIRYVLCGGVGFFFYRPPPAAGGATHRQKSLYRSLR